MINMRIGHASIDERGKIAGGNAGDQTGKELCVRTWYSKNWTLVLRCKNKTLADIMARECEKACANNNIGYDQNQRNTLRNQALLRCYDLSKITTPCECDCSSLMAVCAECAGIAIPYSGNNAPTTRTMRKAFESTGMFDVLKDSKYLTSPDYLRRGDILVLEGHHTVMALDNGPKSDYVPQKQEEKKENYIIGNTYTLNVNLNIRDNPFGEKVKFSCITADAQKHSKYDDYGNAVLLSGTKVTCRAVSKQTDSTWILIPSGWVCAIESGKVYIS